MRSMVPSSGVVRPEDELILCCARTRLQASTVERVRALLGEGVDWTRLVTAAIRHGVGPLLYWHLNTTPRECVPTCWARFLRDHFHRNAGQTLYLTRELVRILKAFSYREISAIPYKGPVLSALAYGNLALRPFVDLDIIICQKDIARAYDLLVAEGYRSNSVVSMTDGGPAHYAPGEHLFTQVSGSSIIELHTESTLRHYPVRPDLELLRQRLQVVSVCGHEVPTFSLEDSLSMLCVHATKHFWSRLIWISDIAELVQNPLGINWERAAEQAGLWNCKRMLYLGLCLAHDVLEAPLPEDVLRQVQANPAVKSLATRVREQLFRETRPLGGLVQRLLFRMRTREKLWDGARYCLRLATTPAEEDWSYFRLPRVLASLYVVLRPLRLVRSYGLGLMPRPEPDLAPFVPTPVEVVERMLTLAGLGPNDVLYDLGCGDGRIAVAAAKRFGIRAVGVDIDPRRVAEAKRNARRQGVEHLVRFVRQDAKTVDVSEASVVALYLTMAGNMALRQSLREQLRPGARIVSRDFDFGDWPADRIERTGGGSDGVNTSLYLWRIASTADLTETGVPSPPGIFPAAQS